MSSLKVFACLFLVVSNFSCIKEKDCPKPTVIYHIPGLWEGTYQTDQVPHAPTYISFTFYPDGSLIYKSRGVPPAQSVVYAKGSWTLSNNQLMIRDTTVNYTSTLIQTAKFTYDSTKNTLSNGTWQDVTSDDGHYYTGTFPSMEKVTD